MLATEQLIKGLAALNAGQKVVAANNVTPEREFMVNYQRDLCLMTLEPHLTYNIRVKDTAEQLAEKLSQEYRAHMQRRGALRQEFFENLAKRIQSEEFN